MSDSHSTSLLSSAPKKVVLLGMGVPSPGKTSLYGRVFYNEFQKTSQTIGAYFGLKNNFAIWDTSSNEKFVALTTFYSKEAAIFVDCVSINDAKWPDNLSKLADFHKESQGAKVVIMVTMCDKNMNAEQTQRLEAIKAHAREHNLTLYYSSAKDNLLHDINGTSIEGNLNGGFVSELGKVIPAQAESKLPSSNTDEDLVEPPTLKSTTQKWSLFFAQIGFLLIAIGFALSPPIFTPANAWAGAPFLAAGGAFFLAIGVAMLCFDNWFKDLWNNHKLLAFLTLAIGIALMTYPFVVSSITEAFGATAIVAEISFIVSGLSMLVGNLSGIWLCCRQPSLEDSTTAAESSWCCTLPPEPNTVPYDQIRSTSCDIAHSEAHSMSSGTSN